MEDVFVTAPNTVVYQTDDLYNIDIERYEPFYGLDSHFLTEQRKLRHNLMGLLFEEHDRALRSQHDVNSSDDDDNDNDNNEIKQISMNFNGRKQPKVRIELPTCTGCGCKFDDLPDLQDHLCKSVACAGTKAPRYF